MTRASKRAEREAQMQDAANAEVESQGSAVKFHTKAWRTLVLPATDDRDAITITERGTSVPADLVDEVRETARRAGVSLRES